MQDTTETIVNKALWTNEGPGSNPDRVPVIVSKNPLISCEYILYTPVFSHTKRHVSKSYVLTIHGQATLLEHYTLHNVLNSNSELKQRNIRQNFKLRNGRLLIFITPINYRSLRH
jgi:hypothetical protein